MSVVFVSLVTLAAVVLLGMVLAYWTWTWFAPRPNARTESVVEPSSRGASAEAISLFGRVQKSSNTVAAPPPEVAIKLLGVVAASGGQHGYAVVRVDSRETVLVREGHEIAPGVRLARVYPEYVELERNGTRETLAWPVAETRPAPPAARDKR